MSEIAQEYLIPDGTSSQHIKDLIQARRNSPREPAQEVTKRFLDSFDWSLYLAGASVEERLDGGRRQLLWHDLRSDSPPCVQTIGQEPGFAWDLPQGPVRKRVESVLGIRRLLPLLEVHGRVQTLRLLNGDDKTVVRLLLEDNRFRDPGRDREGPLAVRLRLLPGRGYEEYLRETAQMLDQDLGLEPAHTTVLPEALAAAGRRPGDYSSKLDYHLDPDKRADASAKEILLGLLNTLEANIEGTKANLDSEFLHDLRVATRRTRSALTQIKGVFRPELVEDYKTRFAWLQQITGPVRDLDVYLLDFEDYRSSLPAFPATPPGAHARFPDGPLRSDPEEACASALVREVQRLAQVLAGLPRGAGSGAFSGSQRHAPPRERLRITASGACTGGCARRGVPSPRTPLRRICMSCARAAKSCVTSWSFSAASIRKNRSAHRSSCSRCCSIT